MAEDIKKILFLSFLKHELPLVYSFFIYKILFSSRRGLSDIVLFSVSQRQVGLFPCDSLSTQPKDTSCSHYEIPQMFSLTLTKSVMLFSEDLFVGCLPSLQRKNPRQGFLHCDH